MDSYSCCSQDKGTNQLSSISSILRLVGEENRLKILYILKDGQHCVCEIEKHLKLSQSLISHHLKDLRDASLIEDEKKQQWVHYSLTKKGKSIIDLLFRLG
jgi:DNA-binding transcriptional ArsR family regulator